MLSKVPEPIDDDLPDPEVDFEACVAAIMQRTKRTVLLLSHAKRHAYFLQKARSSQEWCCRTKAPAPITERIEQWLARLQSHYSGC